MIHRLGFQTFEFQLGREEPDDGYLLAFTSSDDALGWLKHMELREPNLLLRLRKYVIRDWADPETFRSTDHAALQRIADLLYIRRMTVVCREQRTSSGDPSGSSVSAPPAFPLAERQQRTASDPAPRTTTEAATFGANSDAAAQAAALVAAATNGTPFCEECEKAKQQQAGNAGANN